MKLKTFPPEIVIFTALVFGAFSVNVSAQAIKAEIKGVVAAVRAGEKNDPSVEESAALKPTAEKIVELEKLTFSLINQKRAEFGLSPIAWSDEVAKIARVHSENMVKFKFFGHRDAEGKMVNDRADAIGLRRWTLIGENIAYNRGYKNPVEAAIEKWMLSPSHRDNLLGDNWRESAIGIAVTDDGTFYFTQVFLKRK
jgi:uncharacterized protein YkwD